MKKISLPIFLLLCLNILQAQQPEGMSELLMSPRANVVSYDNENYIEHLRYAESPYLISLTEDWTRTADEGRHVLTQSFDFPRDWREYRIFFRMKARSGYGLWVGDKMVGVSKDCAAVTEFDITDIVRFGKSNMLTVRYAGDNDGLLLDPYQDKGQQNPIPQCSLLLKPLLNVQDYTVMAEYDQTRQSGTYSVEAELYNVKGKGKCYLEVEIWDSKGHQADKLGKWCFFDKRSESTQTISSTINNVLPWNAEVPRLYTAVIRLYDEKMDLQDMVGTKFGFRTIACQGTLTVNGRAITIKGITLPSVELGTAGAVKAMRSQLIQMKCNNINAIRICGGNPSERLLELCDELGFYVVCDANLFPMSSMGKAVATDVEYSDLFADRMRTLYGQNKNHASIIAWSLGTSADNGICMQNAYRTLHQLDESRPIMYSGAQYSDNTDIIAPQDCDISTFNQYLAKSQPRPLVMLTYASTIGNTLGGLAPLWQKVYDHTAIQGGFLSVSDWSDAVGKPFMAELRQTYRPFDIRLISVIHDAAEFEVANRCDFRQLADFTFDYVIGTPFRPNIVSGDVAISLKPGENKTFKLKVPFVELEPGEELFIKFTIRQRANTASVPRNTVLATSQFSLAAAPMASIPYVNADGTPFSIEKDSLRQVVIQNNNISLIFNDSLGLLTGLSYHGQNIITHPLQLNFMRPPSENDAIDPNGVRQWMRYDFGKLNHQLVAANIRNVDTAVAIDVMFRSTSERHGDIFDIRQTYTILPTGDILLFNDVTVAEQIKSLAKIGLQMGIVRDFDTATFLGSAIESYSDRCAAADVNVHTSPISNLFTQYRSVQHAGNRAATRWAAFHNGSVGLYVDFPDTLCNFSIYPYTDDNLFGCREEAGWPGVAEQDFWTLNVDSRCSGVGSTTGGVPIDESVLVKDRRYRFTIHLRPYDVHSNNPADFRAIAWPKVTSQIIEMPVISKSRDRFDAPMAVSITCKTPKVDIRYTLDGSIPTMQSPRYTKPFVLQNSATVKARAFKQGESPSFVATQQFTFDYVVACKFLHKPNTPYNKNADCALYDGELGDVNDLSHSWLGFSGHDVQADLELSKSVNVGNVTLRFAHVPDAWVFAPAEVSVCTSADGKNFGEPISATITYDAADEAMNTTQLQVLNIPVEKSEVRFVRIVAKPIARIPQWHRAKGLKPWIMMDEIEIGEPVAK